MNGITQGAFITLENVFFNTPRLQVRAMRQEDAKAFAAYRNDPDVALYQGWTTFSHEDAVQFIAKQEQTEFNSLGSWYQLALADPHSNNLLGDMALHCSQPQQAEIGFTLAPAHQGKGLAREAVLGLLEYCFRTLDKHRIYASCDPRNVSSMNLLAKAGFRKEAHHIQSYRFEDSWTDDVIYAILAREWFMRYPLGM